MDKDSTYLVLAYYHFCELDDPHGEVQRHLNFFAEQDVRCRIYISEEGINGQMSAHPDSAEAYMRWLEEHPQLSGMHFKIHYHPEHCFPKTTVKYRQQLVALDEKVDLSVRGEHVSPEQWSEMLEDSEERLLLDVRNEYEWDVGHFEGATLPRCATFREFNDYAAKLREQVDPEKTPVMMYCTGGIRCELYSSLLMKHGFDKVYQLNGGVIHYGEKVGTKHWNGKLFVFDDRLTVPIAEGENPVVGKCHHCGTSIEDYYNCANVECNDLFLCCNDCLEKWKGCCGEECKSAPRVRPYQQASAHKPFRRWYQYADSKEELYQS